MIQSESDPLPPNPPYQPSAGLIGILIYIYIYIYIKYIVYITIYLNTLRIYSHKLNFRCGYTKHVVCFMKNADSHRIIFPKLREASL